MDIFFSGRSAGSARARAVHERLAIARVEDSGRSFRFDPALPANPLAESGRGLYLVSALAGEIDLEVFPEGKAIRAVLPVFARAAY